MKNQFLYFEVLVIAPSRKCALLTCIALLVCKLFINAFVLFGLFGSNNIGDVLVITCHALVFYLIFLCIMCYCMSMLCVTYLSVDAHIASVQFWDIINSTFFQLLGNKSAMHFQ